MNSYARGDRLSIALTVDPEIAVPPVHYGGIERIVDMLALALVQRGHDVTLFSSPDSTCPVERVPWVGRSSSSRLDTFRNLTTLCYHVSLRKFDIVHSFSRLAYLGGILPLAVPKLMSYQRAISRRTTAAAFHLSRGTLHFSAISHSMMDGDELKGRWHFVPNGVPLQAFTFADHVPHDAPLVFLGRVEEIKGPHLAIEIARRAGRKLIIAGNVPAEHHQWFSDVIKPFIDDYSVCYLGPVDDRTKNELLGRAAALLMPILWDEPFGIVMAEAMACGTPVIGFRRGAVAEIVQDGATGYIGGSIAELVEAVGKIDKLPRSAARIRAEKMYSQDAVADGYLDVYRLMIDEARSREGRNYNEGHG